MGAWGTGLYSDDTTCEVRDNFVENLRRGMSDREAYEQVIARYGELLEQRDIACLVYFSLADTAWKYGRLDVPVRDRATSLLKDGGDLFVWERDCPSDLSARKKVLRSLQKRLESAQPARREVKARNRKGPLAQALPGDVFTMLLPSGFRGALALVAFADDEPVFSVLNWRGPNAPTYEELVKSASHSLIFPSELGPREHVSFYVIDDWKGLSSNLTRVEHSLPKAPPYNAESILLVEPQVMALEIDEHFVRQSP